MAYNEKLAARVQRLLRDSPGLTEKKMFGGLAYMLNGNMACGIVGDRLMLRLGREGVEAALAEPHTSEMDFTGRVIRTMVYVEPAGIISDDMLSNWVEKGISFAGSLPPK
jgi:TfoX/Sxy family transcriptional regulator of competence genes